jgi:hypothetical protein
VVDLSGVTFVDEEAKRLLKRIIEQDGELRANDVITSGIIEEVGRLSSRLQEEGLQKSRDCLDHVQEQRGIPPR